MSVLPFANVSPYVVDHIRWGTASLCISGVSNSSPTYKQHFMTENACIHRGLNMQTFTHVTTFFFNPHVNHTPMYPCSSCVFACMGICPSDLHALVYHMESNANVSICMHMCVCVWVRAHARACGSLSPVISLSGPLVPNGSLYSTNVCMSMQTHTRGASTSSVSY